MNAMPRFLSGRLLCAGLLSLLLAACGGSDELEVRQWMDQVRQQAQVRVQPLTAPKNFQPFAYAASEAVDPFNQNKLLVELAAVAKSNGGLKPDLERRKEVLENYPLDTIKMVGTLQKAGVIYALLQIDRAVHQVKAGQHLGQNFGLITRVGEESVTIKEIVQDAGGDWVERMSTLELQESKESGK